jgi:succinoglycan biosynthesis transport protein ExoP
MDTLDRPDANLPARLQPGSSRLPAQIPAASHELTAAAPPSPVNSRLLLRGLVRNWWRILLLWLIVSIPGVYLIHLLVEPTYDASSTLRIEPSPELFGPSAKGSAPDFGQYLETQRSLILSNRVLDPAVTKVTQLPGYPTNFPVIRDSTDPKADVRKRLGVHIVPNTYLIQISFSSPNAIEAAEVVNQVVSAFDQENRQFNEGMNGVLRTNYEKYFKKLENDLAVKRTELKELARKGTVEFSKPKLNPVKKNDEGEDAPQPAFETLALDQYKSTTNLLLQTEIDLLDAESRYQPMLEAEAQATPENLANQNSEELQKRIEEDFKNDPEVASLIGKIKAANDDLEHTKEVARKIQEPARIAAQKHLKKLNDQYVHLWKIKNKQIRERILVETGARGSGESLGSLKRSIDNLKMRKQNLQKLLAEYKGRYQDDKESASKDAVEATFVRDEVASLTDMNNVVKRKLEQLNFESQKGTARLYLVDPASTAKIPSANKRQRFMMMMPVGVLFAVLSLFLLLEIKAERVADPDLLSSRVQSEVFALPPLPTSRAPRGLSGPGADDQIDKFIQRLDHLRFAVCGGQQDAGLGRCVLVTSAIGGEGKTTLAAQLAARCGNAGISTLLIDADLRRAALCSLLDVPEGPGLSDILQNEANADEIIIPVQGGTFHLLAAGTPVEDTNRILQGRNFAVLIAQLRQRYDMIIIDSPPILPVPDGLILGRWTDGALLAARFEVSRSPQVERARRQLDSAGIPVLGTVINGMRSSDAYYGRYAFNRQRAPQPDSPGTS